MRLIVVVVTMYVRRGSIIAVFEVGMKKILIILFIVCLPSVARAGDWTGLNTGLEVAHAALLTIDWRQTRWAQERPNEYYEINPALSRHPSAGRIDTWFIAWEVLHPVISYVLPNPYRYAWQAGTLGLEIYCVNKNYNVGVKLKW